MSTINTIIGSILRDIAEAQHNANRYSVQVSGEYSKGQALGNYPVPGVRISDLEMELKYALVETTASSTEQNPTDQELQEFLQNVARQSSKAAITSVLYTWKDVLDNGELDAGEHLKLQEIEQKLRQDFGAFLQSRIQEKIGKLGATLLHPETRIDVPKMLSAIMDVVRKHLLEHSELAAFNARGNAEQRQKTEGVVQGYLRTLAFRLVKDFQPAARPAEPRLEMVISSDALAQLPPERIHTLRFKIAPSFSRLVQVEENGIVSEQLVPADN